MFSYYGSKSKVVDCYPRPVHDKIIEPFAGSARYALKWWERDVLLVDKYEVLVRIWQWLQQCTPKDILELPDLDYQQSLNDFTICQEAKWLIGFCINGGSVRPKITAMKYNTWQDNKTRIAKDLHKIKHWRIELGSYTTIPNQTATWFIDPPYQYGGRHYIKSNKSLVYPELANWCQTRDGQVLVCENTKANWLPFKPMKSMTGAMYMTTEALWSNLPTDYDFAQYSFF